jgi:type VI protein secretion system component VasF
MICPVRTAAYDKDEQLRRDAEKLVRYISDQEEAAKERADARDRAARRGPPDNVPAYLFFGSLLVATLLVVLVKVRLKLEAKGDAYTKNEHEIRARSAAALDRVLAQRGITTTRTEMARKRRAKLASYGLDD